MALQPVLERVFNTKSKIKINGEHANHLVHQSILSLELRRLYVQLYAPPILKKQLREAQDKDKFLQESPDVLNLMTVLETDL